jgi:hypothetical protein
MDANLKIYKYNIQYKDKMISNNLTYTELCLWLKEVKGSLFHYTINSLISTWDADYFKRYCTELSLS